MHSTAVGVGASTGNSSSNIHTADGLMMGHNNDDAMNKIPLKSSAGLDDDPEKNGGEFIQDTSAAEEARRERMRANLLAWMKKLTIVLICFIGIALIGYVLISLCFSDHSDNSSDNASSTASTIQVAAIGLSDRLAAASTSMTTTTTTTPPALSDSTLASLPASPSTVETMSTPTSTPPTTPAAAVASTLAPPSTATADSSGGITAKAPQDVPIIDPHFQSKLGVYSSAAVCSDKQVCSEIGRDILARNGSAVDSAIATLLCNGIVNMHSMGIGGGMLMNVFVKEKNQAYSIDGREVAPFAAYPEMFDAGNANDSIIGGLSIAVPGELMGYHKAHERFGRLAWKELVEPALQLCRDGFYMSQHLYNSIKRRQKFLKGKAPLPNVFMDASSGEVLPVGTKLKPLKQLCDTYQLLADNGPLDFYNGTLAQLVIEDLKELNSPIASYDLESYRADLVSSITMQLGDDILYAMPPVSSGIVVANILSILENFNFSRSDLVGVENQANTIHRFAEAMKFGFAKRWELGDLRFNDVRELVSKLTNPEHSKGLQQAINDSTVLNDIYDYGAQFMGADDYGTSHSVVMAPNGDAVSVTSSINYYFGSSPIGKRTGIVFNNGMSDFSMSSQNDLFNLPPAPSNFVDAQKRPMSSMSPMILADQKGNVRLVLGAAGGSYIISAIVEVAARVLWFGDDIKTAIDAPRFHHQLEPNYLYYQKDGFSDDVLVLLQERGHKIKSFVDPASIVCGIARNATALYANADYRKQGGVAGF